MTDHPTTYKGEGPQGSGIDWDDHAQLHRVGDAGGVLAEATSLRDGTFAELIRHLMLLPEDERGDFCIQKAGDRRYDIAEITRLHEREDFPHGG